MKLCNTFTVLVIGCLLSLNCKAQSNIKSQSQQSGKQQQSEGKETSQPEPGLVQVPKSIDHRAFDQFLKKYVDENGLVNYAAWKKSKTDVKALRDYTDKFSWRSDASGFAAGKERIASLINGYNALIIRTILESYPTESIWETKEPFKGKRWLVGGQTVSVDDIEHKTLRPLAGYRVHAVLACAARSCPPRDAYREDVLDQQLDEAMRRWLARSDLNNFDPQKREARVSSVFKWFKEDFGGNDEGVVAVLAKYAPAQHQKFLRSPGVKVEFVEYHWGLNDQGERGRNYRRGLLKKIFN